MRLLHAGHGNELRRAPGAKYRSERRGHRGGNQRSCLPLRHLSPCRRRHAGCKPGAKGLTMAADGATRSEKFPSGIASVGLGEVTRQVPLDEPPPLPANAGLTVIGKPIPRQNGRAKVTGAIRFTVDVNLPGLLHGRILRATVPHARIRAIDVSAAARHPGVRAVMLVARPDDPVAAVVRYVGAPMAAIAAVSIAAAEEALRLIRVDYETLPFVADMDKARDPAAPRVYDSASAPEGYVSGFPAQL